MKVALYSQRVCFLAVQYDVEPRLFGGFVDLYRSDEIDQPQHAVREAEGPRAADESGDELLAQE